MSFRKIMSWDNRRVLKSPTWTRRITLVKDENDNITLRCEEEGSKRYELKPLTLPDAKEIIKKFRKGESFEQLKSGTFKSGTFFGDIVVQSKDDKEDFRAFAHVRDRNGQWWELRGYGKTAGEAADDAWQRYQSNNWDMVGYHIDPPG